MTDAAEPPLPVPHPMRRNDREITEPAALRAILQAGNLLRIALVDGDRPFLLPVFYGFDGANALYLHSARSGRKIDILKRNNQVCFEVSLDHGIIEDKVICDFEARHRTVIGEGRAVFVQDEAERRRGLDLIVGRFTAVPDAYPAENLQRTAVIRIDIHALSGKQHGMPIRR